MSRMVLLVLLLAACGRGDSGSADHPAPPSEEVPAVSESPSIDDVLARHSESLMAHDGIQGIYVGQTSAGDPCLVVMATVPADSLSGVVPDSLEGWPVRIESGDEIRPMH